MPADRARVSHDPSRRWRGLVAQQGRVTVEADWNEAAAIGEERDRELTRHVVGPVGTPDGGYAVTADPVRRERGRWAPGRLTIARGTLFLGGERLELPEPVHYLAQPDWLDHSTDPMWRIPNAPGDSATRHELVYLLAFEQEVSAVEDPALADVALGGPDTMQRRRMLQRFVRHPSESGSCEGSREDFERSLAGHGLRFDPATMRARSLARLSVSFTQASGTATGGQLPLAGTYLGAENQMIRVMVTRVDDETGEPTIVWGFDDASFLYRVTEVTPDAESTTVTLARTPVDSFHYPVKGQAVELLRDAVKLTDTDYIASSNGFVTEVARAFDPATKTLVIPGFPAETDGYLPDYLSTENTPQRYLRVWQATARAEPGKPVPLGDTAVTVTLSSEDDFRVGDFWHFAVRPLQPGIVYPERYASEPQPPDGPRFWACPLAVVTWRGRRDEDDEDEEEEEEEEENEEGEEGGRPRTENCVPRFPALTALAAGGGGGTVDIGPQQVDGGDSLQDLLDDHARHGPVTMCLHPGTYTLPAPLRLGPGHDGLTLQAPDRGVIVRGPERAGEEFVLGLITIAEAGSVTIRGIELAPPLVRFSPAERSFSGLHPRNRRLLAEFCRELHVAIGVSARDAADLSVEDCTFRLPETERGNAFAAGILASGAMEGARVTGCGFQPADPEAGHRRGRRRPLRGSRTGPLGFHGLAEGTHEEAPDELTFGYLQVPRFAPGRGRDGPANRLDDAIVELCRFDGVTVPALIMAHVGELRIGQNSVRDAYGGFWVVSLADSELGVIFDRITTGDADAYQAVSSRAGGTALMDRIFGIATAMARVLPEPSLEERRLESRRIVAADAELLAIAHQAFSEFFRRATGSDELPGEISALFRARESTESDTEVHAAASARDRSAEDSDGWQPRLRLDLGACQIDAILPDSACGAGVLVADLASGTGSALIHDNRIRGRFPGGETVFVGGIAEACVTGNIVANETDDPGEQEPRSHSLKLFTATEPRAVAITGNVFIAPPRLPPRGQIPESLPPLLHEWDLLNTVIRYREPEPEREAGSGEPRGGAPRERARSRETRTHAPRARSGETRGDAPRTRAGHAYRVVITNRAEAGRSFELTQDEMIIGREEGSHIRIEDGTVSHNHAVLRARGEIVTIEDLQSTNGTRVNDVLIERQTPIGPGDRIEVGAVHLVVERHETENPEEA